jgi:hypothetical protein
MGSCLRNAATQHDADNAGEREFELIIDGKGAEELDPRSAADATSLANDVIE